MYLQPYTSASKAPSTQGIYCRFDLRICVYHTWAYCLGVTWYTQILISTSRYLGWHVLISSQTIVYFCSAQKNTKITLVTKRSQSTVTDFRNVNKYTSSVLKRKGYYQKIRHPEGYMDPRGYVDLAQDLLNWFDLKDVKIWRPWSRIFVFPRGFLCKNSEILQREYNF